MTTAYQPVVWPKSSPNRLNCYRFRQDLHQTATAPKPKDCHDCETSKYHVWIGV